MILKLFLAITCLAALPDGKDKQNVVHPEIGKTVSSADKKVKMTLVAKKQHFSEKDKASLDRDIWSPKSINIHPNGQKYYVNSLEGSTTIVYDLKTNQKLKVIKHVFTEKDAQLWSKPCGYYNFNHHYDKPNTFKGKPVESAFSHNGKYLWVPYYRRSFDLNAQDPSAVAIIDTEKDEIVRLMETGPLPKMVAVSGDSRYVAITHWGDNTVGLIDIASNDVKQWKYKANFIIDRQLKLDFSLKESVNRDTNSGYCLRGTVFTPDDHYLLVSCMAGDNGIAVIDLTSMKYLGRIRGMMGNVRHLVIKNDYLYLSTNNAGCVQRIALSTFLPAIKTLKGKTTIVKGWTTCKVGQGVRTIELSPNGRYVFASCNTSSEVDVIDTQTMKTIISIPADSYPVGLDVSKDGRYVITTSQGKSGQGGNAVDIFRVDYR